jgi:hypothetical protein
MKIEVLTTGDNSELVTSIPVTYGKLGINCDPGSMYAFRVVYSMLLEDIKAGDVISFISQGQVSNKLLYNVMVGCYTILGGAKDTTGIKLTKAATTNLNPERHHHEYLDAGFYKFDEDLDKIFINTIWYSASTAAKAGASLKVEPNYGNLQVMLFKKEGVL